MNKYFRLILCLALPLAIGGLSGLLMNGALKDWFPTLNKPSFNPPDYVFGPVWTTLYLLMGISYYLVSEKAVGEDLKKARFIYGLQLGFNFFWSLIFFNLHSPAWALPDIAALWISIVTMIVLFYRIRPVSAYLQIPYLLWVSFASVLNYSIWHLN